MERDLENKTSFDIIDQSKLWEEKQLECFPQQIWNSDLTEKIRRILLLIKFDLGTNPHVFVEGKQLINGGLSNMVHELNSAGWKNIQASTQQYMMIK